MGIKCLKEITSHSQNVAIFFLVAKMRYWTKPQSQMYMNLCKCSTEIINDVIAVLRRHFFSLSSFCVLLWRHCCSLSSVLFSSCSTWNSFLLVRSRVLGEAHSSTELLPCYNSIWHDSYWITLRMFPWLRTAWLICLKVCVKEVQHVPMPNPVWKWGVHRLVSEISPSSLTTPLKF